MFGKHIGEIEKLESRDVKDRRSFSQKSWCQIHHFRSMCTCSTLYTYMYLQYRYWLGVTNRTWKSAEADARRSDGSVVGESGKNRRIRRQWTDVGWQGLL